MQFYRPFHSSARCPSSRSDSLGFISLLCHPFLPATLSEHRPVFFFLVLLPAATELGKVYSSESLLQPPRAEFWATAQESLLRKWLTLGMRSVLQVIVCVAKSLLPLCLSVLFCPMAVIILLRQQLSGFIVHPPT
jgi:hypothetical protein